MLGPADRRQIKIVEPSERASTAPASPAGNGAFRRSNHVHQWVLPLEVTADGTANWIGKICSDEENLGAAEKLFRQDASMPDDDKPR